jgi:exosortase
MILAAAWLLPVSQVRFHWGDISYYNYGWAVPFLAAWLLYQNLFTARASPIRSSFALPPHATLIAAGLLLLLLLPFHALSEVNPFWRAPLWGQALLLLLYSLLSGAYVLGPRALPAMLFPLLLLSTMIPWPYRLETALVQGLTHLVSALSVNVLLFIGFPFELQGNSLHMGETRIGINEACSGIRSLQALFMVTLFMCGVFEISARGRVLSLLLLPLIVLLTNTARAVFLSMQLVLHGDDAYSRWHDPAGLIAFSLSMLLLILVLSGISRLLPPRLLPARAPMALPAFRPDQSFIGLLLLPLLAFCLVEGWFRLQEWRHPPRPMLEFSPLQTAALPWQPLPIHEQISAALGFSHGARFLFQSAYMGPCEAYFYGYHRDNKLSSVSSYGHSPLICMEATGARLITRFAPLSFDSSRADGSRAGKRDPAPVPINLEHAQFRDARGRDSHVFWETFESNNRGIAPDQLARLDYLTQWRLLLLGRRDYSRQVLLLNINGALSAEAARQYAFTILAASLRSAQGDGAPSAITPAAPLNSKTPPHSPREDPRRRADIGAHWDPNPASEP